MNFSRRDFLKTGAGLIATLGGAYTLAALPKMGAAAGSDTSAAAILAGDQSAHQHDPAGMGQDPMPMAVGEVDHAANGFTPEQTLTEFDYGEVSTLPSGQVLREYHISATNKEVEIMPGIKFAAWVYNGRIPGPTIRCTEGDRVRIKFVNASTHPHSMHFHGFHPSEMDGVPGEGRGLIQPGDEFTYEFDAGPYGLHLYHCHAFPLARHIAKGLYGAFIVDPPGGRPAVDHELVMVMSGFDVDFDNANDFYAVNAIPFHFQNHPIQIGLGEKVRVYLVNITEFDPINSFPPARQFLQLLTRSAPA